MLCEKDNLAGAPQRTNERTKPPSPSPPLLLPVRTEGRERKPKAAEGEREELKTILMTQDQLLLPPPPPGKKKENKGEEGEATTRRGGDDLSFFVTIFSSVFPMAGERENRRITSGEREKRE